MSLDALLTWAARAGSREGGCGVKIIRLSIQRGGRRRVGYMDVGFDTVVGVDKRNLKPHTRGYFIQGDAIGLARERRA